MYTDTSRPNHLAQEVINNSVDEALAGHATRVDVTLFVDGSCQVADDGRGMPVDIHPHLRLSGVELILTLLHSGGSFSNKPGGLRGVGVSIVNALSKKLEVRFFCNGAEYAMNFVGGEKTSDLKMIGTVPKNHTGTTVRFWPDEKFFDSPRMSTSELKELLHAKVQLCPNLRASLHDQTSGERIVW